MKFLIFIYITLQTNNLVSNNNYIDTTVKVVSFKLDTFKNFKIRYTLLIKNNSNNKIVLINDNSNSMKSLKGFDISLWDNYISSINNNAIIGNPIKPHSISKVELWFNSSNCKYLGYIICNDIPFFYKKNNNVYYGEIQSASKEYYFKKFIKADFKLIDSIKYYEIAENVEHYIDTFKYVNQGNYPLLRVEIYGNGYTSSCSLPKSFLWPGDTGYIYINAPSKMRLEMRHSLHIYNYEYSQGYADKKLIIIQIGLDKK